MLRMPRIDNELLAILRADSRGVSRRALIVVMTCRHRDNILLCRQMPGLVDEALARLEAHGLARSANVRSGRNGCGRLETWYAVPPEDDEEIEYVVQPEDDKEIEVTADARRWNGWQSEGKPGVFAHSVLKKDLA